MKLELDLDVEDIELRDQLYKLGYLEDDVLSGEVIHKSMEILEDIMKPFGYDFEDYLLYPLDKNGNTLLPNYQIGDIICSEGATKPLAGSISRVTAESLLDRRKKWDYIKILFKYLLILIIKFIMKIIDKFLVWPLKAIVKFILRFLGNYLKRTIAKVSHIDSLALTKLAEDREPADITLYHDITMYNDNNGTDKYVWVRPFYGIWFAKLYGYYPALKFSYPSVNNKRFVKRINILTDYIEDGYMRYGYNVAYNHSNRSNDDKYNAIVNLTKAIIFNIEELEETHWLQLTDILINPNKDLRTILTGIKDSYPDKKIIVNKTQLNLSEILSSSITSDTNSIDLLANISLIKDRNPLYIDPNHVLVIPDRDSIKLKKTPRVITMDDDFDQTYITTTLKGVKKYISPECAFAATSIIKHVNSNRRGKRAVVQHLLNKTNLELQATLVVNKIGKNPEFNETAVQELNKTEIGQKKIRLAKNLKKIR